MDSTKQRVVLETERHRIVGDLTLPREGYLSRFSDFLDRNELRFITLSDVTVFEREGTGGVTPREHAYISVGSDHILMAYPDDEERAP